MAVASTTWWIVGYVVGGAVILVAAALLLVAILLVRRIIRQAGEIVAALEGTHANTDPLLAIADVNLAVERIGGGLARLRAAQDAHAGGNGAGGVLDHVRARLEERRDG